MGYQAGYTFNTTGNTYNTVVGYKAGYTNATGVEQTFFGDSAGYSTTGNNNSFFGAGAGYYVSSGSKNTIIGTYTGNQGGLDIRTSSNNIVLSDGDGNPRYIDAAGLAMIGVTTNPGTTRLTLSSTANGATGLAVTNQSGTATYYAAAFYNNGASYSYCGGITVSGTTTAYTTSSDYRLKNTITPMTGALAKVALLKPCVYKWNVDGSDSQGFIAHELAEVVPECVVGEKDAVDANGKPQYQGIDTSFLVATLTAAIQELKAEVDSLKAQINGASA
jgi:hypothetical protein